MSTTDPDSMQTDPDSMQTAIANSLAQATAYAADLNSILTASYQNFIFPTWVQSITLNLIAKTTPPPLVPLGWVVKQDVDQLYKVYAGTQPVCAAQPIPDGLLNPPVLPYCEVGRFELTDPQTGQRYWQCGGRDGKGDEFPVSTAANPIPVPAYFTQSLDGIASGQPIPTLYKIAVLFGWLYTDKAPVAAS